MSDMSKKGCVLLLLTVIFATVTSAYGECAACGGATSQQDVLNNEWAAFLGKANASAEVVSSTGGLVNPQYSRQNNPLIKAESSEASSNKEGIFAETAADPEDQSSVKTSSGQENLQRSQKLRFCACPIGKYQRFRHHLGYKPKLY